MVGVKLVQGEDAVAPTIIEHCEAETSGVRRAGVRAGADAGSETIRAPGASNNV